jgi:hypothetical protein
VVRIGVLAVGCATAACSSRAAHEPPGGGPSSSPSPAGHVLLVTDAQDRRTVTARVGDVVRVQLGSTYWRFDAVTGPVLRPAGAPAFAPGPSCVPGGGCGTITQTYRARATGTAHVTASRTTCGEALRCAPSQRSYAVTVVVRG